MGNEQGVDSVKYSKMAFSFLGYLARVRGRDRLPDIERRFRSYGIHYSQELGLEVI